MRTLRRFVLVHRRWLAAALLAVAVFSALSAIRSEPPGVPVLVASQDLAAGHTLAETDTHTVRMSERPSGADLSQVAGRVVAAPMRAGEVVTDRRLLGPDLLAGYDGDAVLVRVAVDQASARTVAAGDVVSVLAGDDPDYVVKRARVAMGDGQQDTGAFSESLIGLIVQRDDAPQLARHAESGLTLVLEHRQTS